MISDCAHLSIWLGNTKRGGPSDHFWVNSLEYLHRSIHVCYQTLYQNWETFCFHWFPWEYQIPQTLTMETFNGEKCVGICSCGLWIADNNGIWKTTRTSSLFVNNKTLQRVFILSYILDWLLPFLSETKVTRGAKLQDWSP